MSTSAKVASRGHRHTQSAAKPSTAASSQNPQNPHHLNQQAHSQNTQLEMKANSSHQPSDPTTPPRTPRRDAQSVQQPNSNAPENGSKQRSRNNNRPKNVMTSPAVSRNDRNTPPFNTQTSGTAPAKPMNTPSTAAYAGTTFHASPAPSALPIPSFYSKSVPDSPGAKTLKSLKEPSVSTPIAAAAPVKPSFLREESPLDLFFKADREEKARARSASAAQNNTAPGPFQPPGESPRHSQTPPYPGSQNRTRPGHKSRVSSSGIFAMELDGESDPGTPFGPAFSTPYAERINAARANPSTRSFPQTSDLQQATDRSEALKAYLFSGHAASTSALVSPPAGTRVVSPPVSTAAAYPTPPTPSNFAGPRGLPSRSAHYAQIYGSDSSTPNNFPRASGRTSGLRQEVTPSKPQNVTPGCDHQYTPPSQPRFTGHVSGRKGFVGQQNSQMASPSAHDNSFASKNADLQGMEASLRKILKLDGSGVSGIGQLPAASASVPNYVGGRAPPMNGLHHSVMGS